MPHKKSFFGLFIILALTGLLLRVHLAARSPSLSQYDHHFEYIEEIRAHYSAPSAGLSFPAFMRGTANPQRWHPPAYHMLGALAGSLRPNAPAVPLKILSVLCGFLTLWLSFLILRHFFGEDYELTLPALTLLLFLPGHIALSNLASNDVLVGPVSALFLLLSLKWWNAPLSPGKVASLSLLCGLLLLTKYSGLIGLAYLNAILLYSYIRHKTSFARYSGSALLALAIPASLAGWFYWANYTIWGNPLHMDGFSLFREHNLLSFRFADLLSSKFNDWHESSSVLTGFFAGFFSFDWINTDVREFRLRNAVFCLALPPLLVSGWGLAAGVKKEKYRPLNFFLLLSLLAVGRLLWKFNTGSGALKSCYLMFLAPLGAVYFAEGCAALRAWKKPAFYACLAAVLLLDISVIAYYCRFFASGD